tara:strand:- start:648 stop:2162 length:1515 start_codon:yes stop_codon:yes gene_type:complete
MKKFYITTPLYYVNDEPHIGHAYTTILADVISRIQDIQGNDVYFLTGTDEHGQKVQEAANKNNISPQEHVDKYVKRFKKVWEEINIDYTDFIRTTEPRHTNRVKEILNMLFDKGEIYQNEYEGLYSVSEERFITEKEAEEGNFREIKKLKEKNYFFKMSKYQDRLIKYINDNPNFIKPESRKNEIIGFLKKPLGDLCISRPKERLKWGIELPFDDQYVTYVWFDALINYISAIGWNKDSKKFNSCWPADYHLMAKDILTTHCVYWPTMLMACDIPLPKTIFAHGWWLMDDIKMSKSIGNVIKPLDLAYKYGSDSLRYYLMSNMVLGQDASFTLDSFIIKYNSDLANDYGNLVNRVLIMINKNFDGKIPEKYDYDENDLELIKQAEQMPSQILNNYNDLKIHKSVELIMQLLRSVNKYLEIKAPWKLIKSDNKEDFLKASTTLYVAAEILKIGTLLLYPIMPEKTKTLLDALGINSKSDFTFGTLKPNDSISMANNLFPRIEEDK